MKLVIASGYFNPIHPGHIDYLKRAAELGNFLVVIVNTDAQSEAKTGHKSFQSEADRQYIVESIAWVDEAILSVDTDATVCKSIEQVMAKYSYAKSVIFAKGGDRFASEIPESEVCRRLGIQIVDGLGEKTHHSSEILKNFSE